MLDLDEYICLWHAFCLRGLLWLESSCIRVNTVIVLPSISPSSTKCAPSSEEPTVLHCPCCCSNWRKHG